MDNALDFLNNELRSRQQAQGQQAQGQQAPAQGQQAPAQGQQAPAQGQQAPAQPALPENPGVPQRPGQQRTRPEQQASAPSSALDVIQREMGEREQEQNQSALDALGGTIRRAGEGFNAGLADALGIPGDIIQFGLDTAGVDTSGALGDLVPTSDNVRGGFNTLGIPARREGTAGEVGAAVGSAAPAFGGFAAAARGTGQAQGVLSPIVNSFRQRPGRFAADELAGAVGAGAGGEALRDNESIGNLVEALGGSPQDQRAISTAAGQIGGGLAATGGLGAVSGARRAARDTVRPLTSEGQRTEAAQRLQSTARDPQTAAARLEEQPDTTPGAQLTSAQISQNPGLLALERGLIRQDPNAGALAQGARTETNQAARREIEGLGSGQPSAEATQEFFRGRIDGLKGLLSERTLSAFGSAKRQLDELDVSAPSEDMSRVVRTELEGALQDARTQERALWQSIVGEQPVDTAPLREAVETIQERQLRSSDPANVPSELTTLANDQLGGQESLDEILEFRSRALQAIRAEQGAETPNRRLISNLETLADGSLDALARAGGGSGDPTQAARQFSRELNDRFTRGPVGRILGNNRQGGQRVSDEETLTRLLRPGEAGGVGADAVLNAMGGREAVLDAVEKFTQRKFVEQTVDNSGQLNAAAMRRFLQKNQETLRRFPALRERLSNAESAQEFASQVGTSTERNAQRIRKSRAQLFVDGDPDQIVTQALNSQNPIRQLRPVIRSARRDPSGRAEDGLRQSVVDSLFRERGGLASAEQDLAGDQVLSATQLRRRLENNGFRQTLTTLFGEEGLNRVRRVQRTLEAAESTGRARLPGGSDTAQNLNTGLGQLATFAVGTIGARAGARLGASSGAQLRTASGLSRLFQNRFNRLLGAQPEENVQALLKEAIFDPQVMRDLLVRPTPQNLPRIERRLRSHLANLGETGAEGDDADEAPATPQAAGQQRPGAGAPQQQPATPQAQGAAPQQGRQGQQPATPQQRQQPQRQQPQRQQPQRRQGQQRQGQGQPGFFGQ